MIKPLWAEGPQCYKRDVGLEAARVLATRGDLSPPFKEWNRCKGVA